MRSTLATVIVAAITAAAPHHTFHQHHRPGCQTRQCDHRVDLWWARHHRLRFFKEPGTPNATEASWFDDSGGLACPRASGPGVAHKTLPCGTRIRICNGSRCETATVEDRGPYVAGRELDLDPEARDAISCDTCHVRWGVVR